MWLEAVGLHDVSVKVLSCRMLFSLCTLEFIGLGIEEKQLRAAVATDCAVTFGGVGSSGQRRLTARFKPRLGEAGASQKLSVFSTFDGLATMHAK